MFQLRIPKMVQFVFKIGPVLRTGREGGLKYFLVQFVFKIWSNSYLKLDIHS